MDDSFYVNHEALEAVNEVLRASTSRLLEVCDQLAPLVDRVTAAAEGNMAVFWQERQTYITNLHNDLAADLGDLTNRSTNVADIYLDGDGITGRIMAG